MGNKEKIERLKRDHSKASIESIANSRPVHGDHNTLPRTVNELVVKQYLDMDAPPLNDYSWKYDLKLPNRSLLVKPDQCAASTHALYYDWQYDIPTKSRKDSLINVPIVDWEYIF